LIQFALVPLTIKYINPNIYGVWLTLSSIVGWLSFFDIGLGNGLKNKLTETLVDKDYIKSKYLVSTTYIIILCVVALLLLLFYLFNSLINWQFVLNSSFIPNSELNTTVSIVIIFFLFKLVTDLINVVASAFQRSSVSSMQLFISNFFIIISIWGLAKISKSNFIALAFIYSFVPLFVSLIFNVIFFTNDFKMVKPSFVYFDLSKSKDVLKLGSQFFIIQVVSLILFQTDNILIAQFFTPSDVTVFNIAFKYYSVVMFAFTILLTPYWSAFTEAFYKNEFKWIDSNIKKLIMFWLFSIALLILMYYTSTILIRTWIGSEIYIPNILSITICVYITILNWSAIFANFLNGVGKIKIQTYITPFVGLLNIALSYILVKNLNFGVYAMPLANSICLLFGAVLGYVQYKKILNHKASGIWNK
jgi:O-antigen/teichoic acid export membrane protein